ncbi:MAG: prepilin-type N-terminal cleavage/methylation domain-containing protein [Parcubacteria group bacterium]
MKPAIFIKKLNDKGYSLLEAIIAITIFVIFMSAVLTLFLMSQESSSGSSLRQEANTIAHNSMEAVRSMRNLDFDSLIAGSHGLIFQNNRWFLDVDSPDEENGFTRTVTIAYVDDDTKEIDVNIVYGDPPRQKEVSLVQRLTRWQDIIAENWYIGDWSNPILVEEGNIGAGNYGTDIAAHKNTVYLTSIADNDNNPDLHIFDVSNPSSPVLLSQLNVEQGLEAIWVKGGYAYVVERDSGDFFIIDVNNPSNPQVLSKLTLSPTKDGRSVFALGQYAYVGGIEKEMYIINITDPFEPYLFSVYERAQDDIMGINVLDGIAYLAQYDGKSLQIVDVSDPENPSKIKDVDPPGGSEKGMAVHAKSHDRVYVGRTNGGDHDEHQEFIVVDATNPNNPDIISLYDMPNTSIIDLHIANDELAFLGTASESMEFWVLDITDLDNIYRLGFYDLIAESTGIAYYRNYVYISVNHENALQILTSSP